jgi:ketosteroid isomerase-like protein
MEDRSGDLSEMAAFRAAIDAKYAMHVQAFEDGDPEPILDRFFTEDALWEYAGYPRRVGRAQLRELFEAVIGTDRVAVRSIRSFVSGDCGWDYADYPVTPRDPAKAPWVFRQMFYWVRRDGDWQVNACIGFTLPADPAA